MSSRCANFIYCSNKERESYMIYPKFRAGDRVKCMDNFFEFPCKYKVGTVIAGDDDYDDVVAVEFDDYVDGHSLGGQGHEGHCLWLPDNLLVLMSV